MNKIIERLIADYPNHFSVVLADRDSTRKLRVTIINDLGEPLYYNVVDGDLVVTKKGMWAMYIHDLGELGYGMILDKKVTFFFKSERDAVKYRLMF